MIAGKKIGICDRTCCAKIIQTSKILEYLGKSVVIIPDFQRELQNDKIEEIYEMYIKLHKNNENYLIKHGYTLYLCKLDKEYYVVDGQHRLETMKLLNKENYDPFIVVMIQTCDSLSHMRENFILLNKNSNIAPIYTYFDDKFLRKTIINVKNKIKENYGKLFNRNKIEAKRTYRMHIDTFLERLDIDDVKQFYDINEIDYGNYIFLYDQLLKINERIKEDIHKMKLDNKINYFAKKIDLDKLDQFSFYLPLRNIEWKFNGSINYNIINYKKKTIPKVLRIHVLDRDFGKSSNIGECYVDKKEITRDTAEIGHIKSEVEGGETVLDNLRAICGACNRSMGIQDMYKFKELYF